LCVITCWRAGLQSIGCMCDSILLAKRHFVGTLFWEAPAVRPGRAMAPGLAHILMAATPPLPYNPFPNHIFRTDGGEASCIGRFARCRSPGTRMCADLNQPRPYRRGLKRMMTEIVSYSPLRPIGRTTPPSQAGHGRVGRCHGEIGGIRL
jgi:hypothetical protein